MGSKSLSKVVLLREEGLLAEGTVRGGAVESVRIEVLTSPYGETLAVELPARVILELAGAIRRGVR